jgi:TPR repeat protein
MKNHLLKSLFVTSLIFLSGISIGQTLQEANAAHQRKDFATSFPIYLKFAQQGNPGAQAQVAAMYALGQGATKDEKLSMEWAKKSADQGNPRGQHALGVNYEMGRGASVDYSLAVYWYGKAVDQGNHVSMNNLANLYRQGKGVQQDFQKALDLYNRAISKDSQYPFPYFGLSIMYSNGQGVSENKTEAIRLLNVIKSRISPSDPLFDTAQKSIERIEQKNSPAMQSSQAQAPTNVSPALSSSSLQPNQLDPKRECESKLDKDNSLASISKKISLAGPSEMSFSMLADQSLPSPAEQKAISLYADSIRKCIKDADSFRQQNFSREVNLALSQFDASFMDLAIELYNKKITYGRFNTRLQQFDKDLSEKLTAYAKQANAQKNEQDEANRARDEANRARAEAMRDAQRRQDQARQAEEQRIQQQRQAEQDRINANRSRWVARCNLDKTNAFERAKVNYKNECDNTYRNASNNAINRLGVVACVMSIDKQAEEYAKVTFDACMSGAP